MTHDVDRVQALLQSLSFSELLVALSDTRKLHERLFSNTTNSRGAYAGIYRGQEHSDISKYDFGPSSVLAKSFLEVSENVDSEITKLSGVILRLSVEDRAEIYFKKVVFVYWRFITIHPFVDGNGHIGRLILFSLLERHDGIHLRRGWEVSPTPFSRSVSDCVRVYLTKPDILEGYLRCWFSVEWN